MPIPLNEPPIHPTASAQKGIFLVISLAAILPPSIACQVTHTTAAVMIQSSTDQDLLLTRQYTRMKKLIKARAVNIMTLPDTLGALSPVMAIVRFDPEGCLDMMGQKSKTGRQ